MATANELLKTIVTQPDPEGHIIVGGDRFIVVPENLKRLGVQHDHNMETVTFDCPRYWDDRDMSKMTVYINYRLSNGYTDRYPVDNLQADGDIMHFDWTISRNVTEIPGTVAFLVCVMKTDTEGNEERHWNSELNQDCYISAGMETEEHPALMYPDEITQLLLRMATVEQINVQAQEMEQILSETQEIAALAEETKNQALDVSGYIKNSYAPAIKGNVSGENIRVDDVSPIEHDVNCWVHGKNLLNDAKLKIESQTINGVTITANADGSYTLSGKNTSSGFATFRSNRTATYDEEALIPAGTYTPTPGVTVVCHDEVTQKESNQQQTFEAVNPFRIRGWYCYVGPNSDMLGGSYTKLPATIYPQLEQGSIATNYEPYIDPTTVTVSRSGKNFWYTKNITYPRTVSGVTVNYDPDNQIYTFNGTSTSPGDIYVIPNQTDIMHINAGETWTLKVEVVSGTIDGVATSSGKMSPLVNTGDYKNTIHANAESLYVTKTYTESADIKKMYFYVYSTGIVFENFKCRIQFERGDKPTAFENSKVMSDYKPASDGTCAVTSVNPTMTLVTDTPGVTIEAEYNRDTTKMFESYVLTDNAKSEIAGLVANDMAEVLSSLNDYATSLIGGGS